MVGISSSLAAALLGLSTSVVAAPQYNTRQSAPALSITAQLTLADSAVDRYNLLSNDSDFVYDFNKGGSPFADRKSFPALVGSGAAVAYADMPPCSFAPVHIHPRANELLAIVDGRVTNYMVPEFGVLDANGTQRVVVNVLTAGMVTLNPQGALHTIYNFDCEPAKGVAGFSSDDVGIQPIAHSFFSYDNDIIVNELGHGVSSDQVDAVKMAIAAGNNKIQECLNKCNGTMRRH